MPARRDLGDGLGDELRDLYTGLEQELAAGIARRLTPGIEAQDWAQRRLAAVGEVRRWATGLADRAAGRAGPAATRAVAAAFRRGSMEALRDLGRPERGGDLPGQRGIDRLAGALRGRLDGTAMPIARAAMDAYQRTVAQAAANVLGGALTRRGAAERAWNGLLDQGFTAFTDVRGRRWAASGYVEMATRTATAQAAVQGHLDRLESLGLDLVIVSDAPQECKLCRPWEGKVLQRAGAAGKRDIEAESELTGAPVTVHIAGSVAEAIGDGLMHPQCRHTVGPYLPGLTRIPTNTADPEGDAARQKLRYLEREQRRWKLREAGALDDKSKAAAAAKVKGRQAEIREHMKSNPTLTRRRDREQIDLANRRREGGSVTAPAPRPPVDPLREALDSGVESERQLGGGVSARVDRLETRSGTPVIRKKVRGASGRDVVEEQDAEELGGLLARAVGARAPRLLRTAPDEVVMAEVRGRALGELDDAARAAAAATDEARSIALSDVLMGNTDRNAGNVIVTEAGTPWAIDHGAAFQFHPEYNPAGGVSQFRGQFMELFVSDGAYRPGVLRPGEGATLRAELEALRPDFERMGRADWLRDALLRLKALEDA